MSLNFTNPIPEATRDSKKLKQFFEKWQIVPYYGDRETTSHSFLKVLRTLSELSPTHNACKEAIIKYTFGNSVDVKTQTENSIPGFVNKSSEPPDPLKDEEKTAYLNKLIDIGINLLHIQELNRLLYNNFTDSGNSYLHIKIIKVGSEYRVAFNSIPYYNAGFLATKPIEDKHLVVTKYFDVEYWKEVPPSLFMVSDWIKPFKWQIRRNETVFETIVHLKNIKDESIYYGRPNTLPVLNHMFSEYANGDLEAKISGTEYVAKKLLLFEELDPARKRRKIKKDKEGNTKSKKNSRSEFQVMMQTIKRLTTNEGDFLEASSAAGITYPHAHQKPDSIDLMINRDTAFSDSSQSRAAKKICSIHGWDRRLTGDEEAKGSLGSNLIINLLLQRNEATIVPNRTLFESFWCNVLKEIGKIVFPGEIMHCFEFPDVVDSLVLKLKEGESNTTSVTNPIEVPGGTE